MDPRAIVAALEPFPNNGARTAALNAAITGVIPPYTEPSCRGTTGFNAGAAIESVAVKSALTAVPVVGSLLGSLSGLLTGHHQAAVRNEQLTLCQAVPAATSFLQGIDQLVETGQLSPTAAAAALDQGFQNWRGMVSGILKDTGGKCNAACCYEKYFQAAIAKRKNDYQGYGQGTVAASYSAGGAVPVQAPPPSYPSTPPQVSAPLLTAPYATPPGVSISALTAASSALLQGSSAATLPQSVLAQAGFTPSSQSTLATALIVGGVVLAGVVLFSFLKGGK